jgi:hypothetical protein
LTERGIPRDAVLGILERPGQIVPERRGRRAYQSQVDLGTGRTFLVRVIVDESVEPPVVVTIYRTSRIAKYWRTR